MKALRVFVVSFVFVAAFLSSEAVAEDKWDYFLLGTLGVHTSDGTAFGGLIGYLGYLEKNVGWGIMGSYELGGKTDYGYFMQIDILNFYFSGSYKLGRSTIMLSQGISNVTA